MIEFLLENGITAITCTNNIDIIFFPRPKTNNIIGADVNSVAEFNKNTPGTCECFFSCILTKENLAHLSARNGHAECVRVFIEKGKADTSILNSDEETIRDLCEEEGLTECTELLEQKQ